MRSCSPEDCACNYMRIIYLIRLAMKYEEEGGTPHICSSDLRDAFRNLPLDPQDWWLAGFSLEDPEGTMEYFIDRAM